MKKDPIQVEYSKAGRPRVTQPHADGRPTEVVKTTPFLDLYHQLMQGPNHPELDVPVMPHSGLCSAITTVHWVGMSHKRRCMTGYEAFDYLIGDITTPTVYWEQVYTFGPLRQTVVLLCAAINGEL